MGWVGFTARSDDARSARAAPPAAECSQCGRDGSRSPVIERPIIEEHRDGTEKAGWIRSCAACDDAAAAWQRGEARCAICQCSQAELERRRHVRVMNQPVCFRCIASLPSPLAGASCLQCRAVDRGLPATLCEDHLVVLQGMYGGSV